MISIPSELKDFSMWLNPTNLKAFNKIEMIGLARQVLKNKVKPLDSAIQKQLSNGLSNTTADRGRFALRIYFYQLFSGKSFSLDLRSRRFAFEDHWLFKGETMAFDFEEKLIESLVETYKIYYHDEAQGLRHHLENMGLIHSSWSENEKEELEKIFMNHFQTDNKTKQEFYLKDLISSLSSIFFFIKERGGKVPSQFSLLGLYLTSLYMNLDSVDEPIDVHREFLIAEEMA